LPYTHSHGWSSYPNSSSESSLRSGPLVSSLLAREALVRDCSRDGGD
jgi:hypothetical protein